MTKLEAYKMKSAIRMLIDARFDLNVIWGKYQDERAKVRVELIDKCLFLLVVFPCHTGNS